jgi:glycosyltransferase involved in cell wall biosynthesis
VPTWQRRTYIDRALESVFAQTRLPDEVIVIDDGSTDGTAEHVTKRWPQVHVIRQDNLGISAARNAGIEAATGHWIALLDSDDRWYPEKLERQCQALQARPGHRFCHTDEHWIRNGRRVNPGKRHAKPDGDAFEESLPLCAISPSSALIERSLLNELGGFDERLPACEDYALWLAITAREPVLLVNEPLLEKHGGHADQLSRRYPAMDGFRLDALARLIEGTRLTPSQQVRALTTYQDKYRVYRQGAARRGRHQEIATRDAQHDRLARMLGLLVDDTQWPTY